MFHTQLLSLPSAHLEHTATRLTDGDVLVLGGLDAQGVTQATALRYSQADNAFARVAPMPLPSRRHTATLLADGDVLVLGVGEAEGRCYRYRPATDAWREVKAPATPRVEHAAVRLRDGSVLITGGRPAAALAAAEGVQRRDVEVLSSCERFDPRTDAFVAAPAMPQARRKHALYALPDGSVLAIGGKAPGPQGTPQRLRTSAKLGARLDAWKALPKLAASERDLCVLEDGRVIGHSGHLFEPRRELWHRVEAGYRSGGPMVLLADGRVACFGAMGEEVFDPAQKQWAPAGPARKSPMRGQLAVALDDERALLVGGDAHHGKAASYAALVEIDLGWQPQPIEVDDMDSAERLLEMLVENGALELDDPAEGLEELLEPVARLLRFAEGAGAQAQALSRLLVEHESVADFFLDDASLKKLLSQW